MSGMAKMAAGLGVAVMVVFGLASCATLNEEECRAVDWNGLGQSDGAAGRSQSYFEWHREACAKHGLSVDQPSWLSGWEQGIRSYCTPQRGLSEGLAGRSYSGACPAELAYGFETSYQIGKRLNEARVRSESLQRELDGLMDKLENTEDPEEQRKLRDEISARRAELYHAQARERDAEHAYDLYLLTGGPRG